MPDYMNIDLNMTIDFKQLAEAMAEITEIDEAEKSAIPEGPMNLQLKMKGEYQLFDYGAELELPDLSNAISQEEFMQQLKADLEAIEESEGLINE
jgi:tetrahydromethanopterin S-methyltransferase subunit A